MPSTVITTSSTRPSSCSSKASSSAGYYARECREYGAGKSPPTIPLSEASPRCRLPPSPTGSTLATPNSRGTLLTPSSRPHLHHHRPRKDRGPQPPQGHRGGLCPQPVLHLVAVTPLTPISSSLSLSSCSSSFFRTTLYLGLSDWQWAALRLWGVPHSG